MDSSYFGWASVVVVLVAYSLAVHLAHWAVEGQRIAYSVALGHCLAVAAVTNKRQKLLDTAEQSRKQKLFSNILDCVVAVVAS